MEKKEVYLDCTLSLIPRLLGLIDKNPLSKTYGCFDREFWLYATNDTPSARKQESILTLALLYNLKHPKNHYYHSEKILQFIKAGLNYWMKIQEKNGSFNEWYPKENSFVATSFTLYAITETMLLLDIKSPILLHKVKKAADWLVNKKESRVFNQETGSAIALFNVFLLTKNQKYKNSVKRKIHYLTKNQNEEGWFLEYGGADIGYLSTAVDYLAKLYVKTKDLEILKILKKSCNFLTYFIHPDFTFGGVYGSRNTEYLLPHGFEAIAKKDKNALLITTAIKKSIKNQSFPLTLDDRYLTQILYTWLQAYLDSKNKQSNNFRFKQNFKKSFPNAGLFILSNKDFYFITNCKKAGVFNLYFKKTKERISDSGVFIKTDKRKMQSAWLNNSKYKIDGNKIFIKGNFVKYKSNQTSPLKYFLLRAFQFTLGKNQKISLLVKEFLRDLLITKTKNQKETFEREIILKDKIEIIDKIKINKKHELFFGGKIENIYVPSSNYFDISDLQSIFRKAEGKMIKRIYNRDGKCVE